MLVQKKAQQRIYSLNPKFIEELQNWTRSINNMWKQRFEALENILAKEKAKQSK